jgi:hypothetical protein
MFEVLTAALWLVAGVAIAALFHVGRRQAATHARMRDLADTADAIVDRFGETWAAVIADALSRQVTVLVVADTHDHASRYMNDLAELLPSHAVRALFRVNGRNRIILESGSRILFTSARSYGLGRGWTLDHVLLHAAVSEDARRSLVLACATRAGTVHYLSPVHA